MSLRYSNRPNNFVSSAINRLLPFYIVPQQHIGLTADIGGRFIEQTEENAGFQFKTPLFEAGWSVPTGSQLLNGQEGSIIKVSSQTTDKLDVAVYATVQLRIVNPMKAEAVTGGDYREMQRQIEQSVRAKISATAAKLPADGLRESAELVAEQMRDNLNTGSAKSFVVTTENASDAKQLAHFLSLQEKEKAVHKEGIAPATPANLTPETISEKVVVELGSGPGLIEKYGVEIERINIAEVRLSEDATKKLEEVRASKANITIKANEAIQQVIEAEGRANAVNNARQIMVNGWSQQIASAEQITGLPAAQVTDQVMELLRWDAGKNLVDHAGKGTVILTDASSSVLSGGPSMSHLIAAVKAAVEHTAVTNDSPKR